MFIIHYTYPYIPYLVAVPMYTTLYTTYIPWLLLTIPMYTMLQKKMAHTIVYMTYSLLQGLANSCTEKLH